MPVKTRFRDLLKAAAPWWLSDRPDGKAPWPGPTSLNVGYRVLWTLAAILDVGEEFLYEGVQAAYPGLGTVSALPLIAQTRDLIQGDTETATAFAARLVTWLEQHAVTGPAALALQLHYYLPGQPMVRIVDRSNNWVQVDAAGVVTEPTPLASWTWDNVSNPERAGFWSELWIIIYSTTSGQPCYPLRPGTLGQLTGDDGYGLGLMIPHASADTVRRIIANWKGAHSRIRAVLFTSDPTAYDPLNPHGAGSLWPDGTWGQWGLPGSDPYVRGGRDLTYTRYLEPNG